MHAQSSVDRDDPPPHGTKKASALREPTPFSLCVAATQTAKTCHRAGGHHPAAKKELAA
jgi:hypothetical protein